MRTFEAVTGPKTDRWPVKTVGVLVSVIGASLLAAARARKPPDVAPTALLAAASAAGLGAIDVIYAARGSISRVSRLDAVLEAVLVAGWLTTAKRWRQRRQPNGARR